MVFQLSAACELLNLKKKLYPSSDYSDFRDSSKKFQYHISEKRLKNCCELLSMIGYDRQMVRFMNNVANCVTPFQHVG